MRNTPFPSSSADVVFGVGWLSVCNLITKLLWAGSMILLAQGLGPRGFGELATLWAYAGLAAGFTDLGTGQAMFRAGSRMPTLLCSYFKASLRVKVILTFILWVVIVVTSTLLLNRGDTPWLAWLALIMLSTGAQLLESFFTFFAFVPQLCGRMDLHAKMRVSGLALIFIAFGLLVLLGGRSLAISSAHFSLTLLIVLPYGWTIRQLLPATVVPTVTLLLGSLVREGVPFLIIALLNLAYSRVDTLLLAVFDSPDIAGIYNAQYQLILLLYSIPAILMTVMLPPLYRASNNTEYLQQSFRRITRYLHLIAWFVTPMLFFASEPIMHLVGGSEFARQHLGLRVLALMIPMFSFTAALEFLVAVDKLWARIGCELSALVITALGGILAIPSFSIVGMAAMAVVGFSVSGILALWLLAKARKVVMTLVLKDTLHLSVLMAPALLIFLWSQISYLALCILYGMLGFGMLTLFHFWSSDDCLVIRRSIHLLARPQRNSI